MEAQIKKNILQILSIRLLSFLILCITSAVIVFYTSVYLAYNYDSLNWEYSAVTALITIFSLLAAVLANYFFSKLNNKVKAKAKGDYLSELLSTVSKSESASETIDVDKSKGKLPIAALVFVSFALISSFILQFGLKGGNLAVPFTVIALILLWFTVVPPIRLIDRGFGELLLGFTAVYLPICLMAHSNTGSIDKDLLIFALPLAFSAVAIWLSYSIGEYFLNSENSFHSFSERYGIKKCSIFFMLMLVLFIASFLLLKIKGMFLGIWFETPTIAAIGVILWASMGYYRNLWSAALMFILSAALFIFTSFVLIKPYFQAAL